MNQTEINIGNLKWTDLEMPTKEGFEALAAKYGIPVRVALNCLNPDYLPHIESYGATQFVILRFPEPESKLNADTVQELTTKIAIFYNAETITTVHRLPLQELSNVQSKTKAMPEEQVSIGYVLASFFKEVAYGFDTPLTDLETKMEIFEERIFHARRTKSLLRDGYYLKRKASAYKKVVKFTMDVMAKAVQKGDCPSGSAQETKDNFDRCLFYADDVFENVQGLLNLHIALESQKTNEASFKTNEIVRVLTVLSIFFLPLNFLAGLYGMNFVHIPLLQDPSGFWYALGFMVLICGGLMTYVVRKGWFAAPPRD